MVAAGFSRSAATVPARAGLPSPVKAISTDRLRLVEDLVRRHQAAVRGYLAFLGCPAAQLDDLAQDTFLCLLAGPFEERGEAATRAYLRTVARNLLLKSLRRERSAPPFADLDAAETAWREYEGDDGGAAYVGALRACLDLLRAKEREVLDLRYRASLQQAQIAARLGLSEGGVKSILVRTRKRLRTCVERRLDGGRPRRLR